MKLISFLRLPIDVSETPVREALRTVSENLLATYLKRVKRIQQPGRIKDTEVVEMD